MESVMNKVFILLFLVFGFLFCKGENDTTCIELKKVLIKDAIVEKNNDSDSLIVKFTVVLQKGAVRSQYKMIFQPYLKSDLDSLKLDGIVIYGKNKIKREEQERILKGKRYIPDTNNYERFDKDSIIYYSRTIAYQPWILSDGVLNISQILEGCCNSIVIGENNIAYAHIKEIITVPKIFNPVYSKLKQNDNWKFSSDDLTIYFIVSKILINDTLFSNQQILKEVIYAVNNIKSDKFKRLNKIEITGHASPEGPFKFNTFLGKNRAIALRDYIKSQVDWLSDDDFQINNGIENWEGIRKMVAASDMLDKEKVLYLLDNVKPEDGLKKQLMDLEGGKPWKFAVKNYFPKLRTARFVSIGYSLTEDDIFFIGNKAADLLSEGKYQEAFDMLKPFEVRDDMRLYNLLGVCYIMLGDENTAIYWFEKAITNNDSDAIENMSRIFKMNDKGN